LYRFELYKRLILKYCKYPNRILDIGCGQDKEFGKYFAESMYDGVDKVFGDDIEFGNQDLSGPYDLVVMSEVIEHLRYIPLWRFKYPNASYLISMPNDYNLVARLRFLFGGTIDTNALTSLDKHVHYPTLEQTDKFVRQNFKVIKRVYRSDDFFLPNRFLMFLARICPQLFARGVVYICQNSV
jgi:hypothetical protein